MRLGRCLGLDFVGFGQIGVIERFLVDLFLGMTRVKR
jgi:hypothetical protein